MSRAKKLLNKINENDPISNIVDTMYDMDSSMYYDKKNDVIRYKLNPEEVGNSTMMKRTHREAAKELLDKIVRYAPNAEIQHISPDGFSIDLRSK